jgi:hypothetical protein
MELGDRIFKIMNALAATGYALLLSFVGVVVKLLLSPSDSDGRVRVFGYNVRPLVGWLLISWAAVAIVMATFRWRETNKSFRVILAANSLIAGCLLWLLVAYFMGH